MEEQDESQVPINVAMSAMEVTEDGKLSRDMLISVPEEFIGSPDIVNIMIEVKNYSITIGSIMYSIINLSPNSNTILISYEKQK